MKNWIAMLVVIPSLLLIMLGCNGAKHESKWKLMWSDEFNSDTTFNTLNWSKVTRAHPDWQNYMSDYDSLYAIKEGNLILRGIQNTILENDTAKYLTGGLWSKDKQLFDYGRIEVRAKLDEGKGVWPAIWMIPQNNNWPYTGEIDIMEHLNNDTIVYQTVHSAYTYNLGMTNTPKAGYTHAYKNKEYNTYAIEKYPDSICFFVNDVHTFTYPKIETDIEGQFPFNDQPFYIILSMQLGGSWVGAVNPEDVPVEMWVDWVRYYQKK